MLIMLLILSGPTTERVLLPSVAHANRTRLSSSFRKERKALFFNKEWRGGSSHVREHALGSSLWAGLLYRDLLRGEGEWAEFSPGAGRSVSAHSLLLWPSLIECHGQHFFCTGPTYLRCQHSPVLLGPLI